MQAGGGNNPNDDTEAPNVSIVLDFNDITETTLIDDWREAVLFEILFDNENNSFLNQNFVIGDPIILLNVRRLKEHENEDPDTRDIFPTFITSKSFGKFESLEGEADTRDVIASNGEYIEYYSESDNMLGGFVLGYSRNKQQAQDPKYLSDLKIVSENWHSITLFWIYVNRNNDLIVSCHVNFVKSSAGNIVGSYRSQVIIDHYNTSLDYFRAFLEVLFLILTSWYLLKFLRGFVLIYLGMYKKYLEDQDNLMKSNSLCFRVIGINKYKYSLDNCTQ